MDTIAKVKSPTREMLLAYTKMLLMGIVMIFVAIWIARVFNSYCPVSTQFIAWCRRFGWVGVFISLGQRSWRDQSWGGETFSDRLENWVMKISVCSSIFAFMLAEELLAVPVI